MRKFITAILFLCLAARIFAAEQEELDSGLEMAISNKDIAAARSLLEAGANPNAISKRFGVNSGNNLFMVTISYWDNIQMMELLLDHGANLKLRDNYGRTAVYYARNTETLELFADRRARFDVIDNEGRSPLMYYIIEKRGAAADFALDWELQHSPDFTAGLNSRKDYLSKPLGALMRWDGDREGQLALAKRLLDLGADPSTRNEDGDLIFFMSRYDVAPNLPLARLFIERGAPVNELYKDKTLLMYAVDTRGANMVEYLLNKGADPNQRNTAGETALMHAWQATAVNLLLAHGADSNIQDNEGRTALMKMRYSNNQRLLLQNGADPSIKDNRERTVLHRGAWHDDIELLDEFLSLGCSLNDPDIEGHTPLWDAAYFPRENPKEKQDIQYRAISAMLERGADPNAQDNKGVSVLHYYLKTIPYDISYGRSIYEPFDEIKNIVTALLSAGARPEIMDENGNSALLYILRKTPMNKNYSTRASVVMEEVKDMIVSHASRDERKSARAIVAKEKSEKRKAGREAFGKEFSENLPSIIGASIAPLVVGGLSVGMREGAFAGNPSGNFMVPLNSMFTMGMSCMIAGSLTGLFTGLVLGAGWGSLATALLGEVAGLITGIIIANKPAVQNAFRNNPLCYYAPIAWFALTATIRIVSGHGPEFPFLLMLFNDR